MRQIILDTETSGLDFEKDRIIEVGCLELKDNVFTGTKFHQYYKPDNLAISSESEKIHGLNSTFLSKFNTFDNSINEFLSFIDKSQLIIHNAQFDLSMINHALKRNGIEEIEKDYVKTAKSKGLSEASVLFKHVFKNALIPILTGVVVILPLLFLGSLIVESFFGIPGLGSYTIDAIQSQDFAIVRAMVFLGTVLYIIGLILTDISYTLVDPRVRLK